MVDFIDARVANTLDRTPPVCSITTAARNGEPGPESVATMSGLVLLIVSSISEESLRQALKSMGAEVTSVPTVRALRAFFSGWERRSAPTSVITEDVLPDGSWVDVLECLRQAGANAEVLVTSRTGETELWCEVIQRGAFDLLPYPIQPAELERLLESALLHLESRRHPQAKCGGVSKAVAA